MKKNCFTAVFMIGIIILFIMPVFARGKNEAMPDGKIRVAATFNALQELAQIVGGDNIYVQGIIPSGMDAHDFEPKAGDMQFLDKAQVVIYNGLGMEPWIEEVLASINNQNILKICTSEQIEVIKIDDSDHEEGTICPVCGEVHEHHHHDHCCHHGGVDPHVWLSLDAAKMMAATIRDGFSKIDPDHAANYKANAAAFIAQADNLLTTYREKFASLSKKHFVTGHAAFGYLCRDFGLEQRGVEDVFSSGEPSAKQLAQLSDYCKEHGIKTIFSEKMVSPEVSKTLAREVGADVQLIYTLETSEDNLSYLERMKLNLERIYTSLAK